ncbi:MAG: AAA family ATPase, partial [Nanoarchaeota archaeon]|nr:AAA family ATPase [Nanoarchaeota archaeon]
MDLNDLESRLKRAFNEISKFHDSTNLTEFDECFKLGFKEYIDGNYVLAKNLFNQALEKSELKTHKISSLQMLINSNIELFNKEPTENEFRSICKYYEQLLSLKETTEYYSNYLSFLSNNLSNHQIFMDDEAIKIAERATSIFPFNLELNDSLFKLYGLVGETEKAYDVMVHTCKLAYRDPNFLYSIFFEKLFEPAPNSKDSKTIPINILMEYKDKEILSDSWLLYNYADLVKKSAIGQEQFAYWLFTRVFKLNPNIMNLKTSLFEAYNEALLSTKDEKSRMDLQIHFEDFAKQYSLNNDPEWKNLWNIYYGNEGNDPEYDFIDEDPDDEEKLPFKPSIPDKNPFKVEILMPKQIKEKLDDFIIGQEEGKKAISVAFYQHLLRISNKVKGVEKSNILILAPTGCGKTYIAQIASQIFDWPFVIGDATKITDAGYVGMDTEDLLSALYTQCEGNLSKAEKGIIYLDEGDKIRVRQGIGKDIGGEGAQQQLLKLIEGSKVHVEINKKTREHIIMDTSNILFIVGGAFSDTMMGEDLYSKVDEKKIGFGLCNEEKTYAKVMKKLTDKDLHKYGFIPEFAGRLHHRIILDSLTKEDLRQILIKPKNALLSQYEKIFNASGIKLEITEDALDNIAERSSKSSSGARSLRSICE